MNFKQSVAFNALCNWTSMGTQMFVGFLIAPFLVHHLRESTYGLWILIGALTSYFGVFDLGVISSVGRNVAFSRARDDIAGVNGIVSAAVVYLSAVAALSLLATAGAFFLFFMVIEVEPGQVEDAKLAILLVGLNFALTLPLNPFDAVLYAYQRSDLQAYVEIPTVLARAGLTYWLISAGHGLVALAVITLVMTLCSFAAKTVLAVRLEPALRIGFSRITRATGRELFSYGIRYFPFALIRSLGPMVTQTIVGSRLGTALVTPLSIAHRLLNYANCFLLSGTNLLTPVAATMHAHNEHERQRELFVVGGRACLVLTLLFTTLFTFLGPPFIRLWMGPGLEIAYPLLLILSLGELLPMSQQITVSVIQGKGRVGILTVISLLELSVGVGLTFLLVGDHGVVGACVAVAIAATIFRGVCPLVFACRAMDVPMLAYIARALIPAFLIAAGPTLLLWLITTWWLPDTWTQLFICGGCYAFVYGSVAAIGLFGPRASGNLFRPFAMRQATDLAQPELLELSKDELEKQI